MKDKNSIALLLDSDFHAMVSWLAAAAVPIVSWTVIA